MTLSMSLLLDLALFVHALAQLVQRPPQNLFDWLLLLLHLVQFALWLRQAWRSWRTYHQRN
jgi:hypothetical protein